MTPHANTSWFNFFFLMTASCVINHPIPDGSKQQYVIIYHNLMGWLGSSSTVPFCCTLKAFISFAESLQFGNAQSPLLEIFLLSTSLSSRGTKISHILDILTRYYLSPSAFSFPLPFFFSCTLSSVFIVSNSVFSCCACCPSN